MSATCKNTSYYMNYTHEWSLIIFLPMLLLGKSWTQVINGRCYIVILFIVVDLMIYVRKLIYLSCHHHATKWVEAKFYEQILLMLLPNFCMYLYLYALVVLCTLLLIKAHILLMMIFGV